MPRSTGWYGGLRAVRMRFSRISGFPLDAGHLALLVGADALAPLAGHRHQADWAVAGVDTRATPLLRATRTHEAAADLPAPDAATTVLADYRSQGLSLTQHPVALLREQLAAFKVKRASGPRRPRAWSS